MASNIRLGAVTGWFERRPAAGYAFAAALFAAALAARFALDGSLPPGFPFITFFPAVILAAFLAGTRPGLLCGAACGLAAWYWFLPPPDSWALEQGGLIALAFYVFVVGIDVALIDWARRERGRFRDEAARNAELNGHARVMMEELQHRVANNMALMAATLALYRREAARDPARAPALFADAESRLATMGRVHRTLHDPAAADRPLGDHLGDLVRDLAATDSRRVAVTAETTADARALRLDMARLTPLSLLVAEAVANSLKHGFAGRDAGVLRLRVERDGADALVRLADDGRGLAAPAIADGRPAGGLGQRIMGSLAKQLGGRFDLRDTGAGAEAVVRFAV